MAEMHHTTLWPDVREWHRPLLLVAAVSNLVVAVFLVRRQVGGRPLTWAVRAGTVISLLGMGMAFLMTRPTAAQRDSLRDGGFAGIIGGHSVGVADSGPIMPVTGWSTTGGDLRRRDARRLQRIAA